MLELVFELSIRPKEYRALLDKEQAYSPSTVRYINRFHLFFEFIALMFVIPDFLPLFVERRAIAFSFIHGAVNATDGSTVFAFIAGNLHALLIRIRLFGLIRHKRNHWISPPEDNSASARQQSDADDSDQVKPDETSDDIVGASDDDSALRRADTIGTALLLVNSQRAMLLL